MKFSFNTLLTGLSAIILSGVIGIGFMAHQNSQTYINTARQIESSHKIIAEAEVLRALDEEYKSDLRTYTNTGDLAFAREIANAKPVIFDHIGKLKVLVNHNPVQQKKASLLFDRVMQRAGLCDKVVGLAKEKGLKAAANYISGEEGEIRLSGVGTAIGDIELTETNLLKQQEESSAEDIISPNHIFLAIAIPALLVIICLFIVLRVFSVRKKKEEEKLKQGELQFRELFESAPEAIGIFDADTGMCVDFNTNMLNMFNYPAEELLQKTPVNLSPSLQPDGQESASKAMGMIAQVMAGKKPVFEWTHCDAEGRKFPCEVRLTKLSVPGRNLFRGSMIDISEKKLAEQKLSEANLELNRLFNNIDEVLYTMDMVNFKTTQISPACEKLYGYTASDFYADPELWIKIMHPDDAHLVQEYSITLFAGHQTRNQLRIIRKDKSIRWVETSMIPTLDGQGQLIRIDGIVRDVTEKKNAEELLKQSEIQFREFFESAAEAIAVTDMCTGRFVDFNSNMLKMLNYTAEQMMEKTPADISPLNQPNGRNSLTVAMEQIALAMDGKNPIFEWTYCNAEGRQFPCEVRLTKLSVAGRTLVRGSSIDISEKKQAEQKLNEANQELNHLFNTVDEVLFSVDMKAHKVTQFSAACKKIYGYEPSDFFDQINLWSEVIHPDDKHLLEEHFALLNSGKTSHNQYRIIHKSGEIRWLENTVKPTMDTQGTLMRLDGVTWDISEKKKAEEALRQSEANIRTIFENTEIGFLLIDTNNIVAAANEMINQLFIQSFGTILTKGMNIREMLVPEKLAEFDGLKNMIETGGSVDHETQYPDSDGTMKWYHVTGKPVLDESKNVIGLCFAIHNIALRKKAEAEVMELNESLEKKVKERTAELQVSVNELESFSYSVSHDLRAPLRVINGYAKVLVKSQGDKLDKQAQEDLQVILSNAAHMGSLIDDLLDFSRLGRSSVTKSTVNMTEIVKTVVEEIKTATNTTAEIKLQNFEPTDCDPALMKQVWTNLISNAVKYSRKKEKPVIEIGATGLNGHRTYFIKDNGAGFDMKHSDKLFAVFQRLHKVTEYEGTGVGLSLVQRIITKHGGKIWGDGKVDEGAAFYFTLDK